jgi:cold shock protein
MSRLVGNVKWFDAKKGFGFILSPEGKDVFVHFSSILTDGFRSLKDGERVEYELIDGDKGLHARDVKRVTDAEAVAASDRQRQTV